MKRFLVLGAVAIAIIVAGLTVLPWMVPDATVRAMAVNRIETVTGLKVTAASEARIQFLPQPQISIDDVRLSLPGERATVAAIDRILGRFGPLSLLFNETAVGGMTLVRPSVTIPHGIDAADEWVPSERGLIRILFDAVTRETESRQLLSLDSGQPATGPLRVIDGDITLLGPDGQTRDAFTQIEIVAEWARLGSPLDANASFVWNGKVVEIDSSVENPRDFLIGVMTPVEADLVTAQGSVSVRGKGTLAEELLIEGSLGVESAAFDKALAWLGYGEESGELPGLDRLSLSSQMQFIGQMAKLNDLSIVLDGNSGTGTLTVDVSDDIVAINGTLAMDTIAIDRYLGAPVVIAEGEDGVTAEAVTPLPQFGDLSRLSADLRLSAREVTGAGVTFGQTAASLAIRSGRIDIGIGEAAYKGGMLSGDLEIRPLSGNYVRVRTKLTLRDVAAEELIATGPLLGLEGDVNGGLSLVGYGRTLKELTRSLRGDGRLEVRDGSLRGIDVPAIAEAIANEDLAGIGFRTGLTTPFEALTIELVTARGVTRTQALEMTAESFEATASGEVDLLQRYVSGLGQIVFYPNGRPQPDADGTLPPADESYEIGFRIDGPLDAPAILPLVPLLDQGMLDNGGIARQEPVPTR